MLMLPADEAISMRRRARSALVRVVLTISSYDCSRSRPAGSRVKRVKILYYKITATLLAVMIVVAI
jgi:hypothetical protein